MKTLLVLLSMFFAVVIQAQDILSVSGNGKLIADFKSNLESPNVKGVYLDKYQTLVSVIDGTQTVKCMVRINSMVNVIGVWELNDLNDVKVKIYEVELEAGKKDILMVGITDDKGVQLNLFRLTGDELVDLGYNYFEQRFAGETIALTIESSKIKVVYDKGSEVVHYGLNGQVFEELAP